jgi:Galactose oxidase, central domain/Abnormal spindle-like microcephaly-assoc'd, ASPM-SPD-2-Hydin
MIARHPCRFLRLRRNFEKSLTKIGLLVLVCVASALSTSAQTKTFFFPTGGMLTARSQHTATLLSDGRVLTAGGTVFSPSSTSSDIVSSAEIYDPATGAFTATGSMSAARVFHTATLLQNGKVLIAGGENNNGTLASAELYDPATGTFSATGTMTSSRASHTATALPDDKVLLAGGGDNAGMVVASAEVYDPATGAFAATGSMGTPRSAHTATALLSGKVLVAGGGNNSIGDLASAELYDPATGSFSATGSMVNARFSHTATLLNSELVLVTGGMGPPPASCSISEELTAAELYNPATGTFTATGSMIFPRYLHTATLLNNNTVLVVGGNQGTTCGFDGGINVRNGSAILSSAELYDSTSGTFTQTADMANSQYVGAERENHTATLLRDGTVLIGGGDQQTAGVPIPSAMLYETTFAAISPGNLTFASEEVGTIDGDLAQTLVLQNSLESSPLNITQVSMNGVNPADFTETNNCLGSIALGATCSIQVTFAPSATGTRAANVVIVNNNDSAGALKVPLSGTGVPFTPPTATVSVSPTSLSFAPQYVGTSSAQQTVTVTNISNSPVTIASVEPSSSDFVVVNNCLNALPANGTCTVLVSFDPTTSGVRTGTITFNDNSPAGFQSVGLAGLSGTGQDFSMAAGSGGGATVSPGQTATYSLALAPGGGFAQSVSLTCSGGPAMSTCSVSPSSIALNGTSSQTATVSVATSAQGLSPIPSDFGGNIRWQMPPNLVQAMTFLVFLMWMASRPRRWRLSPALALATLLCVTMSLSSCGGSTGSRSANSASQSGTYTISVTGNSTSGSASLKHTTKFTLVVQ